MRIKLLWVGLMFSALSIIVSSIAVKDVSAEDRWSAVYDRYTYKDDAARFLDTRTFVVRAITFESPITKATADNKITLYFELGSGRLRPSEIEKLQRFTGTHAHGQVKVLAYTGPLGSVKRNQVVADQRALTVSTWLKKNRVKVSSIQAKPKCCYVSKEELWKNRRVEIVYKKGGDQEPVKTTQKAHPTKDNERSFAK